MERRVEVCILPIEYLLQELLNLTPEVLADCAILHRTHQMLELAQDTVILTRVKLSLLLSFKKLEFKEELDEVVIALRVSLQVDLEESLDAFEALGVLALSCVVNRIAAVSLILLSQNRTHPHKQVTGILFE